MREIHQVWFAILLLAVFSRGCLASHNHDPTHPPGYTVVKERLAYNGWRTVIQKDVKMKSGKTVTFDVSRYKRIIVDNSGFSSFTKLIFVPIFVIHFQIVGQGKTATNGAVTIFCWDSKTKTATMVREYHPGPDALLVGCAAGIVENDKHIGDNSMLIAAQMELEEECHLRGGTWIPLVKRPISMDKYTSTNIFAYLVLDAMHVDNPKPLDDEEEIEIVRNVPCERIMEMIRHGEMNVVGSWVCLLAMEKLRELGEIE